MNSQCQMTLIAVSLLGSAPHGSCKLAKREGKFISSRYHPKTKIWGDTVSKQGLAERTYKYKCLMCAIEAIILNIFLMTRYFSSNSYNLCYCNGTFKVTV